MLAALILAGCTSTPLIANTDGEPSPFRTFQAKESRLHEIGYRLTTANAPFCQSKEQTIGMALHDARSYTQPDAVRSALGLSGDIGVQAVATASPAHLAGLRTNDTLTAIDGQEVDDFPTGSEGWQRSARLREHITLSANDGSVRLSWRDTAGVSYSASIESVPACVSEFELQSGHDKARADGRRVLVGDVFAGLAYPDEELAAVLAHEMAHNVLGHLDRRRTEGKTGTLIRETEREADRLMPWLLANAGFDPGAAVRMMERWGPRHGGGLLRKRSHDGWDERRDMIAEELPLIAKSMDTRVDGLADWLTRFRYTIPAEISEN